MSEAVSYNWRVLRSEGKRLTALELAAVMAYFEDHQAAPSGYRIEAIDWMNPGRGVSKGRAKRRGAPTSTRDARDAMTGHFYYVLRGRLARVRVGSVKR